MVRRETQLRTNVWRQFPGFVGNFDTGKPEIYVSVAASIRLQKNMEFEDAEPGETQVFDGKRAEAGGAVVKIGEVRAVREVVEHGRCAFVEQLPCLRQNDVGIGAAAAEIIRIAAKLAADVGVKLELDVVFIAG